MDSPSILPSYINYSLKNLSPSSSPSGQILLNLTKSQKVYIKLLMKQKTKRTTISQSLAWRRRRDLNPRASFPTYTLSRGASSANLSTSPQKKIAHIFLMLPSKSICMRTPYEVLSGGESGIRTHGRSHVTGFQELKSSQALLSKLNIFCNFTCIFADISPTAVSRNYYSKWENFCQKLKKFHPKSIVPKLQNSPMGDFAVQNAAVIFFRQS